MSADNQDTANQEELQESAQEGEAVADSEETAAEVEVETDPLTLAENERDKFRDQFLRTVAELDNFRKRSNREREELFKYACLGLMSDLLPAMDNLQRAVDAASGDDSSGIVTGVQMVLKQFEEIFSRHGAAPIAAMGEPFDPNFHEALQQVPSADVPPMTVVQELERGFKLHDRVLRPSKVIVSTQPPEETSEEE